MIIFKSVRLPSVSIIAAAILLMAGCGGGGGGGGVTFPTPTLPADAVEFNSANAIDGADAAMESGNSLGAVAKGMPES